jgi:ABC-type branched-subunit amino acid transport system permease subunit
MLREEGAPMALIVAKIALLAVLVILTLGVFPDRRRGAIIAIATCVAAAVVLHFAAP